MPYADLIADWRAAVTRAGDQLAVTYDGDLELAYAPMSVTLVLDDEIDISRGDTLAAVPPHVAQRVYVESGGLPIGLAHRVKLVRAVAAH